MRWFSQWLCNWKTKNDVKSPAKNLFQCFAHGCYQKIGLASLLVETFQFTSKRHRSFFATCAIKHMHFAWFCSWGLYLPICWGRVLIIYWCWTCGLRDVNDSDFGVHRVTVITSCFDGRPPLWVDDHFPLVNHGILGCSSAEFICPNPIHMVGIIYPPTPAICRGSAPEKKLFQDSGRFPRAFLGWLQKATLGTSLPPNASRRPCRAFQELF